MKTKDLTFGQTKPKACRYCWYNAWWFDHKYKLRQAETFNARGDTDDWDRRCILVTLSEFFNSSVANENKQKVSTSGNYILFPPKALYEDYAEFNKNLHFI